VLLGHAAYSRDFEREADRSAARLMRANGWDPAAFGVLFERLRDEHAQRRKDKKKKASGTKDGHKDGDGGRDGGQDADEHEGFDLPIGLATHPPAAERVRLMREATD
jgi:Zn-dependent protease with chaperone function